jgi:uncharacterized protein (TIGR00255 family)
MTGFARVGGGIDALSWHWEIKSVNGRGLDIRCRLPAGLDGLEQIVRKRIAERLQRGSVAVALQVTGGGGAVQVTINEPVLEQIAAAAGALRERLGLAPATVDGLMALRGVVEIEEPEIEPEERRRRDEAMVASLEQALTALTDGRREEGSRLLAMTTGHLQQLSELVQKANATAAAQPQAIGERFQQKLQVLLSGDSGVAPERLDQEVAILITKADVREELDRLAAHIEAVRELLEQGGAVGRRLDFLAQEMNREANTICSKSQDLELTRVGIEMKTVIDQFREQVQNIE